jgi:hypothetical protein
MIPRYMRVFGLVKSMLSDVWVPLLLEDLVDFLHEGQLCLSKRDFIFQRMLFKMDDGWYSRIASVDFLLPMK